jgi:two-component system NarL family sensor kinase
VNAPDAWPRPPAKVVDTPPVDIDHPAAPARGLRLRWAVFLIALLPLVVAGIATAWVVAQRSQVLSSLHLQAVEPVLIASRRDELQKFVNLARSSVAHLVRDGMPDAAAQREALAILQRLETGYDGYFFVFDFDGHTLVYPRQRELEGRNLIDLQDRHGGFPIRLLLEKARAGGGYVDYEWGRPSTGRIERKLGYVEPIAGWEWVLGTGTYVDDVDRARRRMTEATDDAMADTLGRIAAITMLSTLAVVGLALAFNVNEQRKADAKLRAMARQIVMSQEDERARVARELHDGVSQWLASVKYVFESALERARRGGAGAAAEVKDTLEDGVERLQEVMGEVRRISHDLRPALLDDLGLAHALEHLGRTWGERCGIAVTVNARDVPLLPEAVATALFRVAQEALGNVERHARAGAVTISLDGHDGGLRFEVEDDGAGFDVAAKLASPRHGLGLTHMRERVRSLGGRFELRSRAGATRITAVFSPEVIAA